MEHPIKTGRDPVCESIEALLRDLEMAGKGTLETMTVAGGVQLNFDEIRVEAVNYDIALVRLATAMMNDSRYERVLTDALRRPMATAI